MSTNQPITLNDVHDMDVLDVLAHKRAEFDLPANTIYLDGNSLGCLPHAARLRAQDVVQTQWGRDLIKSWNSHGWIDLPTSVGEKIAALIGAAPGQTLCCDSISVNLFKVLSAALMMQSGRSVVLSQRDNFPTDLYMAQGLEQLLGSQRCQLVMVDEGRIAEHLDTSIAVLMLTHVNFRSGRIHDMQTLTQLAHEKGILVIWDLAHSAGVLPLELDQWGVDFAVGCTYKYLNGGPGAPAFVYAAKKHLPTLKQPLSGWMGHKAPFDFSAQYTGADGIEKFLCGTPPVISMSVLDAALDVFSDVDTQQLRTKSQALSELFAALVAQQPSLSALTCGSPGNSDERGAQLAYHHPQAYEICQALISRNVIADFRAPDILRVGLSPLYLRFEDIWHSVDILSEIMSSGAWRNPAFSRAGNAGKVT
jgi:kynureninase